VEGVENGMADAKTLITCRLRMVEKPGVQQRVCVLGSGSVVVVVAVVLVAFEGCNRGKSSRGIKNSEADAKALITCRLGMVEKFGCNEESVSSSMALLLFVVVVVVVVVIVVIVVVVVVVVVVCFGRCHTANRCMERGIER
jgi:hypothetical protein